MNLLATAFSILFLFATSFFQRRAPSGKYLETRARPSQNPGLCNQHTSKLIRWAIPWMCPGWFHFFVRAEGNFVRWNYLRQTTLQMSWTLSAFFWAFPSQPLIWRSVSGVEDNFPQSEILIVSQMFFSVWASGFGTCQSDSSSRSHPYTHFRLFHQMTLSGLDLFIALYLGFYFQSSLCLWLSTTNYLTQFKVPEEMAAPHDCMECVE